VSKRLTRWNLSRKARAWAARNTTDAAVEQWESFFSEAAS